MKNKYRNYRKYFLTISLILTLTLTLTLILLRVKSEQQNIHQMETTGYFTGTYRIVEKSVEYHGGDHSDYIFHLKKVGWSLSDKTYAVSVNQADYYQYEKNDWITCSFNKEKDAEMGSNFQIKEK